MKELQQFLETYPWFLPTIIIFSIWETIWKLIALWKAGRNNHLVWFICIAIINTAGILPIVYILIQRNKQQEKVV
jgi:Family of unknown function (DUF5652)